MNICESHAKSSDLLFSTDPDPEKSKTKCIAFNCNNRNNLADIMLDGNPLPWKTSAKHIGNILHEDGTMTQDLKCKRADFIKTCVNMNQEFECMTPSDQIKLLRIYNSHFTGSSLWSYTSDVFQQLVKSWNVNIRIIFDVPLQTHCWLVERLSEGRHAKQMILRRYVKFLESLAKNKRKCVQALVQIASQDVKSHTGANLRNILLETGVLIVPGETKQNVFDGLFIYSIPEGHEWKLGLLTSLIEIRDHKWSVDFDEEGDSLKEDEITAMINQVCTN